MVRTLSVPVSGPHTQHTDDGLNPAEPLRPPRLLLLPFFNNVMHLRVVSYLIHYKYKKERYVTTPLIGNSCKQNVAQEAARRLACSAAVAELPSPV